MKKTLISALTIICSLSVFAQDYQPFYNVSAGNGNGLRFWNSDYYKIHMGNTSENHYGPVTDYSIKMNMNLNANRGWTWGVVGQQPIAALNTEGTMQLAKDLRVMGHIGIGTTSPRGALDVTNGNVWLTASGTSASNDLYAPGHIYLIPRSSGISYIQSRRTDNSGSTQLQLRTWKNGLATEALRINSDGNVGIGTTTPTKKLELGITAHGDGLTIKNTVDKGGSYITLLDHDGKQANIASFTDDFTDSNYRNSLQFFARSGKNIQFATSSTTSAGSNKMVILNNGNVGIGTTNPAAKLDVNGNIRAEKIDVIVDVPASDYVFKDDYNLRSLEEVETFVKENKHLPEVPSAAEFKENGYSVGEMDDLLLRKVEELTLYIIEQQKLIKQLQEKVENLENQ